MIITRPASKIQQGNLRLFATSLRVGDLKIPNFFRIDTLDSGLGVGYQRVLNEARAKRLSEYLLDGHKEGEAFLPTSIFLATDKLLPFDEGTNTITIDTEKTGAFNVVDGQHRIRGLILASEKDSTLDSFEVPVNIAIDLDEISQMCHFLIVNTTQKSVDAAIEQQIVARLTDLINFKKMPVLPRWIQRQVDKGEDQRALALVQFLNLSPESPWKGRVLMANSEDESGSSSVSQKSFVTSIKKHVLVPSNPVGGVSWTVEKQQKVLLNYWRAIKRLLVDKDDEISVVFRTNGLELFHGASPAVFLHLANRQDFKEETIVALLTHAFDNLPTEFLGMAQPAFWYRGSTASGINRAAIRKYANALAAAINVPQNSGDAVF
jgi:DGQHR domain-containing protein